MTSIYTPVENIKDHDFYYMLQYRYTHEPSPQINMYGDFFFLDLSNKFVDLIP